MIIGNPCSRVLIEVGRAKQIAILPTVGIIWGFETYRFAVGFLWLNIQIRIGFFKINKIGKPREREKGE